VNFEPGRALRYIHKLWNGRHVCFFANLNPNLVETTVTLRGRHDFEAWDPHTGAIGAVDCQHASRKGTDFTDVRIKLPQRRSVFLVSANNPATNPARPSTPRAGQTVRP
jgi:hypothetical protein